MRTQDYTNNECHSNAGDVVDQKNNKVTGHDLGEYENRYYKDDQADFDPVNESLETNNGKGVDRNAPAARLQITPLHMDSIAIAYYYLQLPNVIKQVNSFYGIANDYNLNLPNHNIGSQHHLGSSSFYHRRETNNDSSSISHISVESYYDTSNASSPK